jgi:carbonic anhydrase/acetyltransferase-like protein (isoleucine patch superfamily)
VILSSDTKKPKIHSSAYVAPSATLSGDVTVGAGCAILHGAVIVAEGAPVTIGAESVIMEHAVVKASGGDALKFPVTIGSKCIVGPHAYVVGATVGDGCFIASGSKIFNSARIEDGAGIAIGAIVHVGARVGKGVAVPMLHIVAGDPATIYPPERAAEAEAKTGFYENVFNVEPGDDARARAAESYSKFLRKIHAQDKPLDDHKNVKPAPRRSGEEPPQKQMAQVDNVVDVMMLELEEMEHRRQEAIKRQRGS